MKGRRGFALLAVLWLLLGIGTLLASEVGPLRIGARASRNRLLLREAGWARDGCLALMLARLDRPGTPLFVDSTLLGRTFWCRAVVTDPAGRIDINLAGEQALRATLGADSLSDAVLDWRDPDDTRRPRGAESAEYRGRSGPRNAPLQDVLELRLVRGLEEWTDERLHAYFTVEGGDLLNVNVAPVELLQALGMPGTDALRLRELRTQGWRANSLDDLRRSGIGTPPLIASLARFDSGDLVLEVEGVAGAPPLRAWARAIVRRTEAGIVVVRAEIW